MKRAEAMRLAETVDALYDSAAREEGNLPLLQDLVLVPGVLETGAHKLKEESVEHYSDFFANKEDEALDLAQHDGKLESAAMVAPFLASVHGQQGAVGFLFLAMFLSAAAACAHGMVHLAGVDEEELERQVELAWRALRRRYNAP